MSNNTTVDDSSFFDDMPLIADRPSGGGGSGQRRPENILCYLKPTPDKAPYVFRLLSFHPVNGAARKEFYIARYVHTMWTTNSNGKRFPESTVICPVSPHVSWVPRGENRYDACPICRHANHAFNQFKQSGYTNREASRINNEFGRKFEGLIPVYVVKDPNNPQNNGKMCALLVNDKKKFDEILETIRVLVRQGIHLFNGGEALDLYMLYGEVEHVSHEGQPNEKVWKRNEITKFKFGRNAYEIPEITKEAMREFPFDEQYYVESSPEDLKEFYERYCVPPAGHVETDIDFDDDESPVPPKKVVTTAKTEPEAPAGVDDLLDGFDDGEREEVKETKAEPKATPKATPKASPKTAPKKEDTDSDLQEFEDEIDKFFN